MLRKLTVTTLIYLGFAGAAIACPDYNAPPESSYRASGKQLYAAPTFEVVAGGSNYIWDCPQIRPGTETGAGYFPTAPDFSFELSSMSRYRLEVSIISECDAALLINTASSNWYYDDDDNGNLDPKIVLTRPLDGRIDIWIGTYDGKFCNAELKMETFNR